MFETSIFGAGIVEETVEEWEEVSPLVERLLEIFSPEKVSEDLEIFFFCIDVGREAEVKIPKVGTLTFKKECLGFIEDKSETEEESRIIAALKNAAFFILT